MKLEHILSKSHSYNVVDLEPVRRDTAAPWWSALRTFGTAVAFAVSLVSAAFAFLAWADGVEQGQKWGKWQAEATEDRIRIRDGVVKIAGLAEAALAEAKRRPHDTANILAQLVRRQAALARQLTAHEQLLGIGQGSGADAHTNAASRPPYYKPLDPRTIVKND